MTVEVINIKKIFNGRSIFSNINFKINENSALVITGRNGSGKSTLVKIIAGLLTQSSGEINFIIGDKKIESHERYKYIGFVSPYLQMYEEFSASENLKIFTNVRGMKKTAELYDNLLKRVNLFDRKDDLVRNYSSGMKQRLKYAFALLHQPKVLILDEPRTNLDNEGVSVVYEIIKQQKQHGIVIVATNDNEDIQHGDSLINLDK